MLSQSFHLACLGHVAGLAGQRCNYHLKQEILRGYSAQEHIHKTTSKQAVISPINVKGWLKVSTSHLYDHYGANYAPDVSIVVTALTAFLHTVTMELNNKSGSRSFQMGCNGLRGVNIKIK